MRAARSSAHLSGTVMVMALSDQERRELREWLAELTRQMEDLAHRVRLLARAVHEDDPSRPEGPPVPDD